MKNHEIENEKIALEEATVLKEQETLSQNLLLAENEIDLKRVEQHVIFCIDNSGSMKGNRWKNANLCFETTRETLKLYNCEGFMSLILFSNSISTPFIKRNVLKDTFEFPKDDPKGSSTDFFPLSQAILQACEAFPRATQTVIVITDGYPTDMAKWTDTCNNMREFSKIYGPKGGKLFIFDVEEKNSLDKIKEFAKASNNNRESYSQDGIECECFKRVNEDSLVDDGKKIIRYNDYRRFQIAEQKRKIEEKKKEHIQAFTGKRARALEKKEQQVKDFLFKEEAKKNILLSLEEGKAKIQKKINDENEKIAALNIELAVFNEDTRKLEEEGIAIGLLAENASVDFQRASDDLKSFKNKVAEEMQQKVAKFGSSHSAEKIHQFYLDTVKFDSKNLEYEESVTFLVSEILSVFSFINQYLDLLQPAVEKNCQFATEDILSSFINWHLDAGARATIKTDKDSIIKILTKNTESGDAAIKKVMGEISKGFKFRENILKLIQGEEEIRDTIFQQLVASKSEIKGESGPSPSETFEKLMELFEDYKEKCESEMKYIKECLNRAKQFEELIREKVMRIKEASNDNS